MCAFTAVNGSPSCQNTTLLTDILKGQLGFKGFVMSDYGANLTTVESANAGLDMDQPGVGSGESGYQPSTNSKWGGLLLQAVQSGQVSQATLDDHVAAHPAGDDRRRDVRASADHRIAARAGAWAVRP